MKIAKEFMIDGEIVHSIGSFSGIDVYEYEGDRGSLVKVYFAKGCEVVGSYTVEADCGQNEGFISDTKFRNVK